MLPAAFYPGIIPTNALKSAGNPPISNRMTTSGAPALSLLDSVLNADNTRQEISVAVLKKAQDVTRQQGEAMIQLIDQAAPKPDAPLLDVYA